MVRVVVDRNLCKGSACYLCIEYCPKKILVPSDIPSKMDGTIPVITDNALCIDCGLCEIHCPEMAISVEHDEEPLAVPSTSSQIETSSSSSPSV